MKEKKEIIFNEDDMPMPISKINKFERDNDLVINVYSYEKDENTVINLLIYFSFDIFIRSFAFSIIP